MRKLATEFIDIEESERDPPSGKIHVCDVCGREDVWTKHWLWYGSYKMLDDGDPIFKACSIDCMENRGKAEAKRRRKQELQRLKCEEAAMEEQLKQLRERREAAEQF